MEQQTNIISDLNYIMEYILNPCCDNLTILEKIRWIYIQTGKLFYYNFNIINNKLEVYQKKVEFGKDEISSFQTCLQISQILNIMLNNIDPDQRKSKIISRELNSNNTDIKHVANEITLKNNQKYILDLTLDLYLIQGGFQTSQFGYTTDINGTQDIIPLNKCKELDKKLDLIPSGGYRDDKLKKIKQDFIFKTKTKKEQVKEMLEYIKNNLIISFEGPHEGKMYIKKIILELIYNNKDLNTTVKEYNAYFSNDSNNKFITFYSFDVCGEKIWYSYSNKLGFMETSPLFALSILEKGWNTNSNTLKNDLNETINKKL